MKKNLYVWISLIMLLASAGILQAQTPEQRAWLLELSAQFSSEFAIKKAEAIRWAEANNMPVRQELEDGTIIELMYLNEHGMPMYNTTFNAEGATVIKSDRLYPGGGAGLNLTGAGQTLGMWDGGGTRTTHQEFHDGVSSRVAQIDVPGGLSNHATHVAGTMIASGADATARGMSYAANLDAYDWNSDVAEMTTASAGGLKVSQHSYGLITGWAEGSWSGNSGWHWWGNPDVSETEDYYWGFYSSEAQSWDNVSRNAPNYLIVKSAGNDRGQGITSGSHYVRNPSNGWAWEASTTARQKDGGATGYHSVAHSATSKNIITVGAVNNATTMSSFSGWGPTDDGRIKPDIVAKGVAVYSSLATADNTYASWGGTSMSGPMVSGSVGLLLQHQENLHPGDALLSSTMKALILHTAEDLGNPGPDYSFGWGLMDTEAAAAVMTANATTPIHIFERTLNDGDDFNLLVKATGSEHLRATIVWTDVPGTPPAASLNPTTLMLVNDLDMRLTQLGGATFEPYILDPANPANDATTGDNFRDNVEVVHIASPIEDGLYSLSITHKGSLSGGSQQFSLIVTGNKEVNEVYIVDAKDDATNYSESDFINQGNNGYGFGPWYNANSNGGFFRSNASEQGANSGTIDTGGNSFGMWANNPGFSNVGRQLIVPTTTAQSFSFDIAYSWDNGNRGFTLNNGGWDGPDEVFFFNINSSGYSWSNGGSAATTPWPGQREFGVALSFTFTQNGNDVDFSFNSPAGGGPTASGTINNVSFDRIKFYVGDAGGGTGANLYFNSLDVETIFTSIPADATARIIGQVDQDEHLTVEDLLIESGNRLHVKPGKNLSVTGDLINTAGSDKFVLESDATGTASLLHQNNDVDLSIQRYHTGDANTLNMHYHTVSVPLTQGSNPVTGLFTGAYLYRFDQPTQNYVTMGTSTTTPLNVNEGYLTYFPGANTTFSFEGKANNGAFAAAVSHPAVGNNYNLVPNPYPSAIDWDAAGWTKTNMNDAIYIYNTASSGTGNVVWASYVAGSGGAGVNGGTNIIPAGQAFFVQSNAADPVLSMTNDVRVHSAQNFYKDKTEAFETLRLFAQANDFEDEIVVRFVEESTLQFDGQYDALKFKNWSAAPNIYSLTPDKTELSISSIPYSAETFVVDLGFEWEGEGDAAINFEGIDSFGDWVTIFFEDKLTGARIDLWEETSYAFVHMPDYPTERFLLRFMGVTGNEELDAVSNETFAWSKDGLLHIYIPETMGKTQIDIFELHGRLLYQQESLPSDLYRIDNMPLNTALLIRLTGSDAVRTQKVINR